MSSLVHRREGEVSVWEHSKGTLRMWMLSPTTVTSRIEGFLDPELARAYLEFFDTALAKGGKFLGLNDWSKLDGYAPESRKMITRWTDANRAKFSRIVVYTESRLVRMGIATANMLLGSIVEAVGSRTAFEKLMADAKAGRSS